MSKLFQYILSEITDNFDNTRVPLSAKQRESLKKIYPYYGAQNIIDYVDDYLFDGEYILVAEDGENLKSQKAKVCNLVSGQFWVNNHAHIIRGKKGNHTRYIYYFLNLIDFKPFITGSAQPKLTKDSLNSIPVRIHAPEEQKAIASVLSALDDKIELNNKINTELESLAKTIYDYWFVQFDFPFDFAQGKPNADGKPYKSSGGEMVYVEGCGDRAIPAGWKIGNISDLFDVNPSETLSKGTVSAYIDMNAIPISGFMTGEIQYKPFNGGMKFRNGDVVIARITPCLENGKTGLITLLKDNEIGFGSTEFIVLRGKNRSLSSFAACLSRSTSFRNFAISNMTGTSGRKRVDAKAIERFIIPIPEDRLLSQFEDVVSRYFQLLTINTRENQQLTQLRDWLLPMLMNGQVSIK